MKKIIILSTFVFLINVPSTVQAFDRSYSGKNDFLGTEGLYQKLGLTDEQKKLLNNNKAKHREERKANFKKMKDKRAEMRQELEKSELDMDKINQIQDDIKSLQAQMLDQRLNGILEVRKIMTPDQFKAFLKYMNQKKGGFRFRGDNDARLHPDETQAQPAALPNAGTEKNQDEKGI